MDESSDTSLLLSDRSSLEPPGVLAINLDEEDSDEADRNNATGFNIFIAAYEKVAFQII